MPTVEEREHRKARMYRDANVRRLLSQVVAAAGGSKQYQVARSSNLEAGLDTTPGVAQPLRRPWPCRRDFVLSGIVRMLKAAQRAPYALCQTKTFSTSSCLNERRPCAAPARLPRVPAPLWDGLRAVGNSRPAVEDRAGAASSTQDRDPPQRDRSRVPPETGLPWAAQCRVA